MIGLILALAAAAQPSAVDAERAFNSMAQTKGQWTAFRAFADPEAVIFSPQPVNAQESLKGKPDPRIAVQWWPSDSFVSCDGGYAVNTGPWARPKSNGYFTTIWRRNADGWKWIYDGGDGLKDPRPLPEKPRVVRAACKGSPSTVAAVRYADGATGEGMSADRTLAWRWHVASDGARSLDVWLWNGKAMAKVLENRIAG